MNRKSFFTVAALIGSYSISFAQTTVRGNVTDAKGNCVPDINVSVASVFTKTNHKGQFSLFVPTKGDFSLYLSAVGYTKEIIRVSPTSDSMTLNNLRINSLFHQIDDVDIMGYNSVNKKSVGVAKSGIQDKDLPQSVQIINSQVISDQQINTLGDALKNANGIALGANRGGVGENFYARGYSLGANNIFKNGARTNNGGQIEASTLESVEVLKGSAAMLYGGVSGGAVVNLVTKKPKFDAGAEVSMRYGSWDRYKPMLDVYGPLSRKVAFRFVGTGESANSYRDQVKSDRTYINPSVLYKISDRTELNVDIPLQRSPRFRRKGRHDSAAKYASVRLEYLA